MTLHDHSLDKSDFGSRFKNALPVQSNQPHAADGVLGLFDPVRLSRCFVLIHGLGDDFALYGNNSNCLWDVGDKYIIAASLQ